MIIKYVEKGLYFLDWLLTEFNIDDSHFSDIRDSSLIYYASNFDKNTFLIFHLLYS